MKINEKILSLPPYISTAWSNISAIMMKASQISITLNDGDTINIPGLEKDVIDLIFKTHSEQIEKNCFQETEIKNKLHSLLPENMLIEEHSNDASLKFGFATLDGFNTAMQHNPLEMNAPDLPQIVLQKIGSIAKILAPENSDLLPKDVPNCNCFHCQITRAINHNAMENEISVQIEDIIDDEEIVSDLELQFNQWDVKPAGEHLFSVINRLDANEEYSVFLGSPVGCNCGNQNCEHIIAALRA